MRILAEDKADSADFAYNHDHIDTNHNYSYDISGSLPSNSSSSTLSPFSSLLLIETLSRKSFSYGKLPLQPIKLTVLKLDGSSFGHMYGRCSAYVLRVRSSLMTKIPLVFMGSRMVIRCS